MPDITVRRLNYLGNATVTVPHFSLEFKFMHKDQTVADLTGANAIDFTVRVQGWTLQQHQDLVEDVADLIARKIAGLAG
jgi:hypothetical protein